MWRPSNTSDFCFTGVYNSNAAWPKKKGKDRVSVAWLNCFFSPPNGKYSKNFSSQEKKERNGRALSLGGNDKTTMNLSYYRLLFNSNANTGFSIENRGFAARNLTPPTGGGFGNLGTVVTTGAILLLSWFISRYNVVSPHAGVSWDMKSYSVPFSFQ